MKRYRFEHKKVNGKYYLYMYGILYGIYDTLKEMQEVKKEINEEY